MNIELIYCPCPNEQLAESLAQSLLEEQLVACANIGSAISSHYHWQGKLCQEREVPLLLKTSSQKRDLAIERLAEKHPYELPAIVSWSASASYEPFKQWVFKETA